jgi:hypothetical protein
MKGHSIRKVFATVAVVIGIVAVAAPVATAVPIGGDDTRYYQEHTKQEIKRLAALRAKKIKKNRTTIKKCPPGQVRVMAGRLGRCIVD